MDSAKVETAIREAFMAFDRDADGVITDGEFLMCIRSMGFHIPRTSENDLLSSAGIKPGETVKFETVLAAAQKYCQGKNPKEDLMKQFKTFDRKGDGTIQALELRQVLESIGEILNDTQKNDLCKIAVTGGNLNYAQFIDSLL